MSAAFSLPPLVDVAHPTASVLAGLRTSLAYEVIAPVSDVLDGLTILSPAQYWATFALVAITLFGFWVYRQARSGQRLVATRALRTTLTFAGGTVAIVGIMLVANRPMAALVLFDRDLIKVDFHSHTAASHDGRAGFDAERNRDWHSRAGFDVAYVTDHRTFDGALSGVSRNPAKSGDATVLLPGVELRDADEHPILIGVDPKRMRITSPDWKEAAVKADGGPAPPILILSLPGNLLDIPVAETAGPVRIAGIEVSDGSPRGMAQAERDNKAIVSLAEELDLALISASDNHGWGRTAPAWTVLRIPGWRAMRPAALDIAIRRTLIAGGSRATEVIARRTVPAPVNKVEAALGGVTVGLLILRTMSTTDRISWLVWSWGLCFVSLRVARANRRMVRIRRRHPSFGRLAPRMEEAA